MQHAERKMKKSKLRVTTLAQSRNARKEKHNPELSKCYNPLLLNEQADLFLRLSIDLHIVLFILSLRLCAKIVFYYFLVTLPFNLSSYN